MHNPILLSQNYSDCLAVSCRHESAEIEHAMPGQAERRARLLAAASADEDGHDLAYPSNPDALRSSPIKKAAGHDVGFSQNSQKDDEPKTPKSRSKQTVPLPPSQSQEPLVRGASGNASPLADLLGAESSGPLIGAVRHPSQLKGWPKAALPRQTSHERRLSFLGDSSGLSASNTKDRAEGPARHGQNAS